MSQSCRLFRPLLLLAGALLAAPQWAAAALEATVSNQVTGVTVGTEVEYQVRVANTGTAAVSVATVRISALSGLSYLNVTGITLAGGAERLLTTRAMTPVDDDINLPAGASILYRLKGLVVGVEGTYATVQAELTHPTVAGATVQDRDPVSFPMSVIVADPSRYIACGATGVGVSAAGEVLIANAGCYFKTNNSGGTLKFGQEGRNPMSCNFSRLTESSSGQIIAWSGSTCLSEGLPLDGNGNGVPDFVDSGSASAMQLLVVDANRQESCSATSIQVGANGQVTLENAGCIAKIAEGSAASTLQFRGWINGALATRGCGFTRLSEDAAGNIQLQSSGSCLAAGAPDVATDSDGDGIPDLYDPAPTTPADGSCTEFAGTVAIANKTYVGTSQCSSSQRIVTGNAVQVGAAVAGADLTYRAGTSIRLLPGFWTLPGNRFLATIGSATSARPADAAKIVASRSRPAESAVASAPARRLYLSELPAALRAQLGGAGGSASDLFQDAAGRFVVFATDLPLLPADRNQRADVYLYATADGGLRLLSLGRDGAAGAGASGQPRIDGSGRYVVFASAAGNLTADDRNQAADIFLYDIASGSLERISPEADEIRLGDARNPAIVSGQPEVLWDRVTAEGGERSIFRTDRDWPELGVEILSADAAENGVLLDSHHPAVSSDGRYVAYLERSGDQCRIRWTDYRLGTTLATACPAALAPGDAFAPEFATDAASLSWVPWEILDRNAGSALVRVANPLLEP